MHYMFYAIPAQEAPDYAPGTQKNVSGEVIRWSNVSGPEKIDAIKYIELLEAEIEELNNQVGRKSANGQNELLEYLKSLEPQNLKVNKNKFPYYSQVLVIENNLETNLPLHVQLAINFFLTCNKL